MIFLPRQARDSIGKPPKKGTVSPQFKRAAVALDGVVEFGAVNCDKASSLCSAQGIKSFPKFLLYSPRYEWSEEYPKDRLKELGAAAGKTSFLRCHLLCQNPNICQDRLGTNIGKS
jgi:hypothetical protein